MLVAFVRTLPYDCSGFAGLVACETPLTLSLTKEQVGIPALLNTALAKFKRGSGHSVDFEGPSVSNGDYFVIIPSPVNLQCGATPQVYRVTRDGFQFCGRKFPWKDLLSTGSDRAVSRYHGYDALWALVDEAIEDGAPAEERLWRKVEELVSDVPDSSWKCSETDDLKSRRMERVRWCYNRQHLTLKEACLLQTWIRGYPEKAV